MAIVLGALVLVATRLLTSVSIAPQARWSASLRARFRWELEARVSNHPHRNARGATRSTSHNRLLNGNRPRRARPDGHAVAHFRQHRATGAVERVAPRALPLGVGSTGFKSPTPKRARSDAFHLTQSAPEWQSSSARSS